MLLVRLSHFVFQVILIFLPHGNIQALDLKGCATSENTVRDVGGITKVDISNLKEHVFPVPAAFESESGKILGRKMMVRLGQVLYTDEESNISGATNFAGKSNLKVKKKLKINSKLMSRNSHPVNVQLGNFRVFNADYHIPRPHPPKNN